MRTLVSVCALLLLPLSALAQETPKVELFGGYSYFRVEGGQSLHGWNASVAANLNKWFGVVAELRGPLRFFFNSDELPRRRPQPVMSR